MGRALICRGDFVTKWAIASVLLVGAAVLSSDFATAQQPGCRFLLDNCTPQDQPETRTPDCNTLHRRVSEVLSDGSLITRNDFSAALGSLRELAERVSATCELKGKVVGGPVAIIMSCHNEATFIQLGQPGSSNFILTSSTRIYRGSFQNAGTMDY